MPRPEPPFDPQELTSEASLNDLVIGQAGDGPPGRLGGPARQLCSRDALLDLARAAGFTELDPARLSDQLAGFAASPELAERQAARRVLDAFGARLGALVATLRRPKTPAQQGSRPARRAYLEHWLAVERVWLAGGLVRGGAGGPILRAVRAAAAAAERPCPVAIVPNPDVSALVGAARFATVPDGTVVVADLGHTSVKTALADIRAGTVVRLRGLASVPAPEGKPPPDDEVAHKTGEALASAAGRAAVGGPSPLEVMVSVASYLRQGRPIRDGRSIYGALESGADAMTSALSTATGRRTTIRFLHDASASAAATGDARPSAVISVGSWLGIGFTPSPATALALSPDFALLRD